MDEAGGAGVRAYYNDSDCYAADWLRNLIAAGLIAPGEVDERSIEDVRPDDLKGFVQCHFFAGIGGWSYALRLAGWPDERPVWTGSCPCQPFSVAGKRAGFDDKRHLWPVFRSLIEKRRPPVVFGEQVAAASDWLRLVRGDLEALEYAVGCAPIEAASAGADHLRDRYWFVADGRGLQARQSAAAALGHRGATVDGVAQGDADLPGPQGRQLHAECAGERAARSPCMADAESDGERRARQSEAGSQSQIKAGRLCSAGAARTLGDDPGDGRREGRPEHEVRSGRPAVAGDGGASDLADARDARPSCAGSDTQRQGALIELGDGSREEVEWVIGADGKARRVKSGIRLLAHGVPARVGKLRAFGNAIDPRPAAAFIEAYMNPPAETEKDGRG